jgi:bifunctional DNA-binding transcriptional regulator/antitoxin component of YhaV-PrlF toxin-antitoxin module
MSSSRIYPADQLTLPDEVSSALQVKEGDFLEVSTLGNAVLLKPTRIVPFGSPAGEEENRRAEQDFREGRYRTFESLESFAEYLGLSPEVVARIEGTADSVERLVVEALHEANGDAVAAAERLEQAKRALESRIETETSFSPSE